MSNRVNRSLRFVEVPGGDLWYRNMQGVPDDYTPAGKRSFSIAISDELSDELENEGWTCITHKPRSSKDPDSPIIARFKIKMNFDTPYPPKVYVASRDGKRRTLVDSSWLDDQNIDRRDIEWCDIEVNPYNRNAKGKDWCSAYLSEITFKLKEGPFDYKYSEDVPF